MGVNIGAPLNDFKSFWRQGFLFGQKKKKKKRKIFFYKSKREKFGGVNREKN